MKIALVRAPVDWVDLPPLDLARLAGTARQYGHDVSVFDLNARLRARPFITSYFWWEWTNFQRWRDPASVDEFLGRDESLIAGEMGTILDEGNELVYFSVTSGNLLASLRLAERLKSSDPDRRIVFGGPYFTLGKFRLHDFIARQTVVDVLIQGPGEFIFAKLLRDLVVSGRPSLQAGLHYRHEGKVVIGDPVADVGDVNALPFADFSRLPLIYYPDRDGLPLSISRGGAFRCVVCGKEENAASIRWMTGDRVFSEVMYQKRVFPARRRLKFVDLIDERGFPALTRFAVLAAENESSSGSPFFEWEADVLPSKGLTEKVLSSWAAGRCGRLTLVCPGTAPSRYSEVERILEVSAGVGLSVAMDLPLAFPEQREEDLRGQTAFFERNAGRSAGVKFSLVFRNAEEIDLQRQHQEERARTRSGGEHCEKASWRRLNAPNGSLLIPDLVHLDRLRAIAGRLGVPELPNLREKLEGDAALLRNQVWRQTDRPLRLMEGLWTYLKRESEESECYYRIIEENYHLVRDLRRFRRALRLLRKARLTIVEAFNSSDWDPFDWDFSAFGRLIREGGRKECLDALKRMEKDPNNRIETILRRLLAVRMHVSLVRSHGGTALEANVPENRFSIRWGGDDADPGYLELICGEVLKRFERFALKGARDRFQALYESRLAEAKAKDEAERAMK